ncbi:GNAT family N-acetyltransferase [Limibacterium fermenti]|uniref:GNAT family N-acetyltransferase n=1 Tax=Limibacterium fermenti TaxID=3229863 RepID=UPI000E8423AB|nr:hypothetical protein [Porphyromonadaceae bacterium]HBX44586.1 hypothetical protein [Porphyromonadaceae bacterium]
MSVTISKINDKESLRKFVHFGIDLYEGNEYYVPPLIYDELATLNRAKNPAFDHCEATYFLAYRDNEIVGRIAVMINYKANERWNHKQARFGFVDFIDDVEVVDALFGAAESWARFRGMEKILGPMGFTDLDHEGMLVEGFDQMGTMATIYNYPYYVDHMYRMGYIKDQDWVEFLITIPRELPERFMRASEIVKRRSGVEVKHFARKDDVYPYAKDIFRLINKAYKEIYGYVELTERQIDYYVDMYIPMLRLDFLTVVIRQEDNKLIGVGIGLPSMSTALQKSRGRFMPTGWYHLYKALKGKDNKVLDLLLVAVDPEYQGKGITALLFNEFIPAAIRLGFEYAESNVELETNHKVHSMWDDLEAKQTKRRRAFIKEL